MKEKIIKTIEENGITFQTLKEEACYVQGFLVALGAKVTADIWVPYLRGESILNITYNEEQEDNRMEVN